MPDQFTEVTKTGYGKRIGKSIGGIVGGIVLFVASFGVLYWNEGRVDVSLIAKESVGIEADQVAADMDGKFISVTGNVVSEEQIGDNMFLVPGDYLAVKRTVEMYAWVEEEESTSDTELGGSETTTTTYTYVKEWTGDPAKTSDFKYPQDHENPVKTIKDAENRVSAAKIGVYNLSMDKLDLPSFKEITLNEQKVDLSGYDVNTSGGTSYNSKPTQTNLTGGYVFIGKGSLSAPEIGDMRVRYTALENNMEGTVFGKLDGEKVVTYVDEETNTNLYRLFDGTRDEAISTMHTEYKMMLWIFRLVGFLMMWFGLSALFAPLSVLLDVVPIFGSLSRALTGVITFVISLVLSIVTIIISIILHNIIALIVTVIVVAAIVIFIMKMKGKKAKPAAAS